MSDDHLPPSAAASGAFPQPSASPSAGWERDVLERLMFATLREQRDARRWRIFFRLIWALVLLAFLATIWSGGKTASRKIDAGEEYDRVSVAFFAAKKSE